MYLSSLRCQTQGLRKAFINSINLDRCVMKNIKDLANIDKGIARTYTDVKYYGGSLKDVWRKVKEVGKKVLNSAATVIPKVYKPVKWMLDKAAKSDTFNKIVESVGNAVGPAVKVPGLGTMIKTGIKAASSITDGIEGIISSIQKKNPQLTVQEIKKVIEKVVSTVKDVKNKYTSEKGSEEMKKELEQKEKEVLNKLPDTIKEVGIDKVEKAAGYLPFLDPRTLTVKSREGKGGRALKPAYRFVKPKIITQYKEIFDKLPKYDAKIIGEVGGRMFLGSSGRIDLGGEVKTEISEAGSIAKNKKTCSGSEGSISSSTNVLERLRARLNK